MKALDALKAAPPEVRAAALAVLDQVSAPLTERQLAGAFRAHGVGLLDAKRMARALRKLDIHRGRPSRPLKLEHCGLRTGTDVPCRATFEIAPRTRREKVDDHDRSDLG